LLHVRCGNIGLVFERWDGTGVPYGMAGTDLPITVRVMSLCNEVEIHHRLGGPQAAERMAQARSGTASGSPGAC